ncbi:glycosyltransferase [Microbacterium lacusdiani]
MRVLHVTEAMGGGIIAVLRSHVRRQLELGADAVVAYTRRPDTPHADDLGRRLEGAELIELGAGAGRRDLVHLARFIREASASGDYDAIHLHSSFAGAVGRLVAKGATPTFYSPHGFAFLRENTSRASRFATKLAERVLARRSELILTSRTEFELAREVLKAKRAHLVDTGVAREEAESWGPAGAVHDRPIVAMVGRVVYQKAPWRFAAVARELAHLADFVWYGVAPDDPVDEWIGDAPVRLVGWMSPDELDAELAKVDILLFPSLWEGMPYALMMAQVRGIPAVVSDVVGNRDAVVHDRTGIVASDDQGLRDGVERLLTDEALRQRMAAEARASGLERLTDARLGVQSLAIYRGEA